MTKSLSQIARHFRHARGHVGARHGSADMPKKIGYVTNYATHEWYQNVIKGMQDRAKQLGIEFEVRDANLDVAKEVSAAEDFMSQGVDVLIITPVNEEGVVPLVRRAKEEGLPLVLEGNPVKGMTTMVAICDYDTGYHAGVEAGKYAKENLDGVAKVMNVGLPLLSATVLRSQGFMDGLKTEIPDATMVHDLDGGGNPDRALEVSAAALAQNSDINIIYGINDSSSQGGLQAWKASGTSAGRPSRGRHRRRRPRLHQHDEHRTVLPDRSRDVPREGRLHRDRRRRQAVQQGRRCPSTSSRRPRRWSGDAWKQFYSVEGTTRTINWDTVNALKSR